jgi:cytochrome c553
MQVDPTQRGRAGPACRVPAFAQTPVPRATSRRGKAEVDVVCAACHGANGVSVADNIPNLAGQRRAYLEAQLRALKSGTRKNPLMNAMAAQLSNDDIVNVAAYFSSLQPGPCRGASEPLPALVADAGHVPREPTSPRSRCTRP